MRRQIRDAYAGQRTHDHAVGLVTEYLRQGRPFSLYLRNFYAEADTVITTPDERDPATRHWTYFGGVSSVEKRLGGAVDPTIRMIGIANPADPIESGVRFPRLEVEAPDWERVVEWLVQGASFIVFDLKSLAPGVSAEMELITETGREGETMVILPGAAQQETPGAPLARESLGWMGADVTSGPTPTKDDPVLARFPRVASEDEIQFDDLAADPCLGGLLAGHDREVKGKRDAPALLRRARFLEKWGVWQHEMDEPGAALEAYVEAKTLFFEANDPAGQAQLLMHMGRAALDLSLYDEAIEVFRTSGATSQKFGDKAGFRGAVLWVAITHYVSGDHLTAAHYLQKALELEDEEGRTQVSIDALDLLGRIYTEEGDPESAASVADDLELVRRELEGG